ncbi:hypothetical protein ACJ41O_008519 [Fusarium nematophilum]
MFDRLSDELVLKILLEFLDDQTPLWLDFCVQLPRHQYPREQTGWDTLPKSLLPDPGGWTYSAGEVGKHLTSAVEPPQAVHARDWLAVNSTCRRFRRLGKALFFSAKTVVVSWAMLKKLQPEEDTSWLDLTPSEQEQAWRLHRAAKFASITTFESRRSAGFSEVDELLDESPRGGKQRWCALCGADKALALSEVRHVVFTDAYQVSASRIIRLPSMLAALPKVRRCTLLVGYRPLEGYTAAFETYGADGQSEDVVSRTAADLAGHLVEIGMSSGLEFSFGLCKDEHEDWGRHQSRLEDTYYPLLKFKARSFK